MKCAMPIKKKLHFDDTTIKTHFVETWRSGRQGHWAADSGILSYCLLSFCSVKNQCFFKSSAELVFACPWVTLGGKTIQELNFAKSRLIIESDNWVWQIWQLRTVCIWNQTWSCDPFSVPWSLFRPASFSQLWHNCQLIENKLTYGCVCTLMPLQWILIPWHLSPLKKSVSAAV